MSEIPAEAVETAYERVWPYMDEAEEEVKRIIRMALEAALPHLLGDTA